MKLQSSTPSAFSYGAEIYNWERFSVPLSKYQQHCHCFNFGLIFRFHVRVYSHCTKAKISFDLRGCSIWIWIVFSTAPFGSDFAFAVAFSSMKMSLKRQFTLNRSELASEYFLLMFAAAFVTYNIKLRRTLSHSLSLNVKDPNSIGIYTPATAWTIVILLKICWWFCAELFTPMIWPTII